MGSCLQLTGASNARDAAEWLRQSYFDVEVEIADDCVILRSSNSSARRLKALWRAASTNEALYQGGKRFRLAAEESLRK